MSLSIISTGKFSSNAIVFPSNEELDENMDGYGGHGFTAEAQWPFFPFPFEKLGRHASAVKPVDTPYPTLLYPTLPSPTLPYLTLPYQVMPNVFKQVTLGILKSDIDI